MIESAAWLTTTPRFEPRWTRSDNGEICASNVNELVETVQTFQKELATEKSSIELVNGLANLLRGQTVQHRSIRQKEELQRIVHHTTQELEGVSQGGDAPFLPGPRDPSDWLSWAFGLMGEELSVLFDQLSQTYPWLSKLVDRFEPAWLEASPIEDPTQADTAPDAEVDVLGTSDSLSKGEMDSPGTTGSPTHTFRRRWMRQLLRCLLEIRAQMSRLDSYSEEFDSDEKAGLPVGPTAPARSEVLRGGKEGSSQRMTKHQLILRTSRGKMSAAHSH